MATGLGKRLIIQNTIQLLAERLKICKKVSGKPKKAEKF
jgi:hypothetical protein